MGYFESVDGGVPVKSYMTHHQGMIMGAIANELKSDCLARRLLSLPEWRVVETLFGDPKAERARRKKSIPAFTGVPSVRDTGVYTAKCGALSVIASERGAVINGDGKRLLDGISVFSDGNKITSGCFYAYESGVWESKTPDYAVSAEIVLVPNPLSAALTVKYRNLAGKRTVPFTSYCEPILARVEDFEAHPAYSRLFIATDYDSENDCVRAHRRGEDLGVLHFVRGVKNVKYICNKSGLIGRGRREECTQNLNPCLSSSFCVELDKGEECEFTCWFVLSKNPQKDVSAVMLASSHGSVDRYRGSSAQLVRSIPDIALTEAARLSRGEYSALKVEGTSGTRPTIAREVTSHNQDRITEDLKGYAYLYEIGYEFDLILFLKKQKYDFGALKSNLQKEIDRSGIVECAGYFSRVAILECDDGQYDRLLNHLPKENKSEKAELHNGKLTDVRPHRTNNSAPSVIHDNPFVPPEINYKLGIGGFAADYSYVIPLNDDTPAPWCNIMSNGTFGSIVTESGLGFTFGENSRQHKITDWSNDPVLHETAEFIAVNYGDCVFGATKAPIKSDAEYTAVHSFGYSNYYSVHGGVYTRTTVTIPRGEDRKLIKLEIYNGTSSDYEFGTVFAVRPVLGDFARNTRPSLDLVEHSRSLEFRCAATELSARICSDREVKAVGARVENGKLELYDAPQKSSEYFGIYASAEIKSGETGTLYFSVAYDGDGDFSEFDNELSSVRAFYDKLFSITFDGEYGYLTRWLTYQTYNSRVLSRAGFYQVSGAYGFRDQLQDCLALVYSDPALVRGHILECARHQFYEGDVQHWWHPPATGVRTHVCDDRLWLVYAVCEYIAVTGDETVLEESVPFLEDVPISPDDASVYTAAKFSRVKATVFEHCLRAITFSADLSADGLVRMRGGDWNDAFDKVGEKGVGTSVWCTMFLYYIIKRFIKFVKNGEIAARLNKLMKRLNAAVSHAFEKDRFTRATCDDGRVLGSSRAEACKIDILTQSWSVISDVGTSEMQRRALNTAYDLLCDREGEIIKLFDPPFSSPNGVGYIGNYPEGVRENGGQYTQAAVWYVISLFSSGQIERANELLGWLSPAKRSTTREKTEHYCVEPYVSAADIYDGAYIGKGGWTWYTGSAAWLYKCLIEQYAGITVRGNIVTFAPKLPTETKELNVAFRYGHGVIRVKLVNSCSGDWRVRIGGVAYNTPSLRLSSALIGEKITVERMLKQ